MKTFGRKTIYANYTEKQLLSGSPSQVEAKVLDIMENAVALHDFNKMETQYLTNYLYGDQDIKDKTKLNVIEINPNKLESNHLKIDIDTLKNDNRVSFSTATASAAFQTQDVLEQMVIKTWLGGDYGKSYLSELGSKDSYVFAENIPYGISIFFSCRDNFLYHGFYTSEKTGTQGVLGYGNIEAANKTDNGKIDTWYELQCALYE